MYVGMYPGMNVCVCMHVCVYVCMHVCMHVCMYACVRVCMYVSMHVCMMYMCMCVRVYMHVCMCACMHVRMHASLGVYVRNKHTYMCMRTHPHNHPFTRTDVYAPGTYRAGAHVRVISRPFPALRGRSNAANCAHSHTAMMMMMSAAKQVRQHTVHMPRRQRTVARGRGVGMPKHAASRAAHDSRRARGDSGPPVRRRALHMEIPGSHDPNKCAHVCGSDACTRARVRAP